jgi:catechol 2,3-dioxygenase-like lactoylglutathione lyase family enzyme
MSEELKFHQVAYVVKDLDKAVKHWADDLGIGPWTVYTLKSPGLKNCVYKGQATDFGIRHAMAFSGNLQFELVEPLHGPSILRDQLDSTGEGMNHVGCIVQDHPAAVADFIARGFTPLQSAAGFGAEGDGAFAYFQPPDGISAIVELISPPKVRIQPDYIYPAPEGK